MLRLLTAHLACVFFVSFLAIGFGAAPVQACATDRFTETRRIGAYLSDFSSRYVNGVGDQWGNFVAELRAGHCVSPLPISTVSVAPLAEAATDKGRVSAGPGANVPSGVAPKSGPLTMPPAAPVPGVHGGDSIYAPPGRVMPYPTSDPRLDLPGLRGPPTSGPLGG